MSIALHGSLAKMAVFGLALCKHHNYILSSFQCSYMLSLYYKVVCSVLGMVKQCALGVVSHKMQQLDNSALLQDDARIQNPLPPSTPP